MLLCVLVKYVSISTEKSGGMLIIKTWMNNVVDYKTLPQVRSRQHCMAAFTWCPR